MVTVSVSVSGFVDSTLILEENRSDSELVTAQETLLCYRYSGLYLEGQCRLHSALYPDVSPRDRFTVSTEHLMSPRECCERVISIEWNGDANLVEINSM